MNPGKGSKNLKDYKKTNYNPKSIINKLNKMKRISLNLLIPRMKGKDKN